MVILDLFWLQIRHREHGDGCSELPGSRPSCNSCSCLAFPNHHVGYTARFNLSLSLSLSIYIYIYIYILSLSLSLSLYIYIYIYIYTKVWLQTQVSLRMWGQLRERHVAYSFLIIMFMYYSEWITHNSVLSRVNNTE